MGNIKMTNEERQEIKDLVRMMREAGVRYRASKPVIELLEGGADEIERLAALAQPDAEPVPLYKDIERILDDESAWIARPNPEVTTRIAIAAFIKAQSAVAQSDAEPAHRDMAYFGASEAACYYYPGEDERLLRDAYCRGAAEYAPKPLT
jgi:hypothetical protein